MSPFHFDYAQAQSSVLQEICAALGHLMNRKIGGRPSRKIEMHFAVLISPVHSTKTEQPESLPRKSPKIHREFISGDSWKIQTRLSSDSDMSTGQKMINLRRLHLVKSLESSWTCY